MVRFFPVSFSIKSRSSYVTVLAFTWTSSLICGTAAAYSADSSYLSLMRGVTVFPVSISGLLVSLLLPFLISAFAVSLFQRWPLYIISFLKGFSFSCISAGIVRSFGSVGWLMNTFVLFSDFLSTPVLFWFWTRILIRKETVRFCSFLAAIILFTVGWVEFRFISPFLANLITYVEG